MFLLLNASCDESLGRFQLAPVSVGIKCIIIIRASYFFMCLEVCFTLSICIIIFDSHDQFSIRTLVVVTKQWQVFLFTLSGPC